MSVKKITSFRAQYSTGRERAARKGGKGMRAVQVEHETGREREAYQELLWVLTGGDLAGYYDRALMAQQRKGEKS